MSIEQSKSLENIGSSLRRAVSFDVLYTNFPMAMKGFRSKTSIPVSSFQVTRGPVF